MRVTFINPRELSGIKTLKMILKNAIDTEEKKKKKSIRSN